MYRIEENTKSRELVISGWENGISQSPHFGIANLRNANTDSVPGEVSVGYSTTALNTPPTVSAVSFSAVAATDVLTVSDTTDWYNGMAVVLPSVGATGLSTGRVYWVGDLSGTTFKLYKNPSRFTGSGADVTGDGSGTITSYTLGKPVDKATGKAEGNQYEYQFILDNNGRAWWIDNTGGTITSNLVYMGNDTLTGANGRAITVFNNHLLVFRSTSIDGVGLDSLEANQDFDSAYVNSANGGWEYGWTSIAALDQEWIREIHIGQDAILYYDNDNELGSIQVTSGSDLDLDDGATFTNNTSALDLPKEEIGARLQLSELGDYLIIGGKLGKIYPWDRRSSSFDSPVLIPEQKINKIVQTNNITFIFAGFSGNIYATNGSTVELFAKIPDHITAKLKPYITINDVEIDNDKLYFSMTVTENDGTAITGLDGVWSFDINTGVFKHTTDMSHGTSGTVTIIMRSALTDTPNGLGLYCGWEDASSNYGIDEGSSDPFTGGETIIDTDIIPIGTFTNKANISQIEYKLSTPLVANESIQIKYRTNLSASWTSVYTSNTVGLISEPSDSNFENIEWIQFRAILTSTATTPSFVRLRELRVRI